MKIQGFTDFRFDDRHLVLGLQGFVGFGGWGFRQGREFGGAWDCRAKVRTCGRVLETVASLDLY